MTSTDNEISKRCQNIASKIDACEKINLEISFKLDQRVSLMKSLLEDFKFIFSTFFNGETTVKQEIMSHERVFRKYFDQLERSLYDENLFLTKLLEKDSIQKKNIKDLLARSEGLNSYLSHIQRRNLEKSFEMPSIDDKSQEKETEIFAVFGR